MICGKMQGLLIEKQRARKPKDLAAIRARMRRHVMTCEFCLKHYNRYVRKK